MKLNWKWKVKYNIKKKIKNFIGWRINCYNLSYGKFNIVHDDVCMYIRKKNMGMVSSTIMIKKYFEKFKMYIIYPIYISTMFELKRTIFMFNRHIKFSRLSKKNDNLK